MRTGKESTENGLDTADLAALVAALEEGKRPTVYLNDPVPGLGLPAGASAKVVAVEGATVRLRPRGVADELPFEAGELRASKTLRAAAKAVGGRSAVSRGALGGPVEGASRPSRPRRRARRRRARRKRRGLARRAAPVVDSPSRSVARRAKTSSSVTIAVSVTTMETGRFRSRRVSGARVVRVRSRRMPWRSRSPNWATRQLRRRCVRRWTRRGWRRRGASRN